MKVEQTECSETSVCKIHTSGNYPEESIQHSEHGESLKSRILYEFHLFIFRLSSEIFEEADTSMLYFLFFIKTFIIRNVLKFIIRTITNREAALYLNYPINKIALKESCKFLNIFIQILPPVTTFLWQCGTISTARILHIKVGVFFSLNKQCKFC
jgi:hypothetical protein